MARVAACKEKVKPFANIHGAYIPAHLHSLISVTQLLISLVEFAR